MNIAVFCASAENLSPVFPETARHLGQEIGRRGWHLVYGGTNQGLMREVASGAWEAGGGVTGIVPECIRAKGVAAEACGKLIVTPGMKERKQLIRDYADAFVALPGGWGTLEEITEVITLKQLGLHHKPVVFLNADGFYDRFFDFIRDIRHAGFISESYASLYEITADVGETVDYIQRYRPAAFGSKYQAL